MHSKIYNHRSYELDLIRFLAAISILIYHYKTLIVDNLKNNPDFTNNLYAVTKFSYLGVDLFFIISGFVIFASASNRTPYQFMVSRVTRIYPTFWLCVTLSSITLLISKETGALNFEKYFMNLTLFHNYFGIENIDSVYWTLVTEIKFYICIFVLLYFKWFDQCKIWISIWLILTILFSIFNQPFFLGWFISPYYSPYFISGIIFYLGRKEGFDTFKIIVLSISMLLACNYAYDIIDSFSSNIDTRDRLIAVFIVICFYILFLMVSLNKIKIKQSRYLVILSGMTYPLYLLHNLIGKTLFYNLNKYIEPFTSVFMTITIVFLMSYLIYIYFETKYVTQLKCYFLKSKSASMGVI